MHADKTKESDPVHNAIFILDMIIISFNNRNKTKHYTTNNSQ